MDRGTTWSLGEWMGILWRSPLLSGVLHDLDKRCSLRRYPPVGNTTFNKAGQRGGSHLGLLYTTWYLVQSNFNLV